MASFHTQLSPTSLLAMEKHSSALIEQLQGVHTRQRKLIQHLQADNARLLSDLADVRRERDAFRAEAAKHRKESADLQNRYDEAISDYQDLKRERMMLSRSLSNTATSNTSAYGKSKTLQKAHISNTFSTSTDNDNKRPSLEYPEPIRSNSTSPYSHRELPDPLKSASPRLFTEENHQKNACSSSQPRTTSMYTIIDMDI